MTQELIQESRESKPQYNDWLRSLKAKVEETSNEEEEALQWKQRYGKT